MKLKLEETDHNSTCKNENFYVDGLRNFGREEYNSWQEFLTAYRMKGIADANHNLHTCFRFDIKEERDEEDELTGNKDLYLYLMFQQKGKFVPVRIKAIGETDMEEINEYLQSSWRYMQGLWTEFSGVENMYPLIKG